MSTTYKLLDVKTGKNCKVFNISAHIGSSDVVKTFFASNKNDPFTYGYLSRTSDYYSYALKSDLHTLVDANNVPLKFASTDKDSTVYLNDYSDNVLHYGISDSVMLNGNMYSLCKDTTNKFFNSIYSTYLMFGNNNILAHSDSYMLTDAHADYANENIKSILYLNNFLNIKTISADLLSKYDQFVFTFELSDLLEFMHQNFSKRYFNAIKSIYSSNDKVFLNYSTLDIGYKTYMPELDIDTSMFDDTNVFIYNALCAYCDTLDDQEISCSFIDYKQEAFAKNFFYNEYNKIPNKNKLLLVSDDDFKLQISSHVAGALLRSLNASNTDSLTDESFLNSASEEDLIDLGLSLDSSLYADAIEVLSKAAMYCSNSILQIDTGGTAYINNTATKPARLQHSLNASKSYTDTFIDKSLPDLSRGSFVTIFYKSLFNRSYYQTANLATLNVDDRQSFPYYSMLEEAIYELNLAYKMYQATYVAVKKQIGQENMPKFLHFDIYHRYDVELTDEHNELVFDYRSNGNASVTSYYILKADKNLSEAIDELKEIIEKNKEKLVINDAIASKLVSKGGMDGEFTPFNGTRFSTLLLGAPLNNFGSYKCNYIDGKVPGVAGLRNYSTAIAFVDGIIANNFSAQAIKTPSASTDTCMPYSSGTIGANFSNPDGYCILYTMTKKATDTIKVSSDFTNMFLASANAAPYLDSYFKLNASRTGGVLASNNINWLTKNILGYMDYTFMLEELSSAAYESLLTFYEQPEILDSICDLFINVQTQLRKDLEYSIEQDSNSSIDLEKEIENNKYLSLLKDKLEEGIQDVFTSPEILYDNSLKVVDNALEGYFNELDDINVYQPALLNRLIANATSHIDESNISNYINTGVVTYANVKKLDNILQSCYDEYFSEISADFEYNNILNNLQYVTIDEEIDQEYIDKLLAGIEVKDIFGNKSTRQIFSVENIFSNIYTTLSASLQSGFLESIKMAFKKCMIHCILKAMSTGNGKAEYNDPYEKYYMRKIFDISHRIAVDYLYNSYEEYDDTASVQNLADYYNLAKINFNIASSNASKEQEYWTSYMFGKLLDYGSDNLGKAAYGLMFCYLPIRKFNEVVTSLAFEYELFYQVIGSDMAEKFMDNNKSSFNNIFNNIFNNFISKCFPALLYNSVKSEYDIVSDYSTTVLETINAKYYLNLFFYSSKKFNKKLKENFNLRLENFTTFLSVLKQYISILQKFIDDNIGTYYSNFNEAKKKELASQVTSIDISSSKYALSTDMYLTDTLDQELIDTIDALINTNKYDLMMNNDIKAMSIYNYNEYTALENNINLAIEELILSLLSTDMLETLITSNYFTPLSSVLKDKMLETYYAELDDCYLILDQQLSDNIQSVNNIIKKNFNKYLDNFMKDHYSELSTSNFFMNLVKVDKILNDFLYNTIIEFPLGANAALPSDGFINTNPALTKNMYNDKYSIEIRQSDYVSGAISFTIDKTRRYKKIGACGNNVFLTYDNTRRYRYTIDTGSNANVVKQQVGAKTYYIDASKTSELNNQSTFNEFEKMQKVEVIKSIDANSSSSALHKTNLYSIDINGVDDKLKNLQENADKIKQQIKNKIMQYVEQMMPLHTQLYSININ